MKAATGLLAVVALSVIALPAPGLFVCCCCCCVRELGLRGGAGDRVCRTKTQQTNNQKLTRARHRQRRRLARRLGRERDGVGAARARSGDKRAGRRSEVGVARAGVRHRDRVRGAGADGGDLFLGRHVGDRKRQRRLFLGFFGVCVTVTE